VSGLLERFQERAHQAGGRVGAVVMAEDGREASALDADGTYPAASVIKLPLVMTLFADAAEGRLQLDESLSLGERVDGSGVLRHLTDLQRMTLRDLAALAMTVSDNTATNRLIERVGLGRVAQRLEEWGCRGTRLERAMFDLAAKERGRENVMTPRETAFLVMRVVRGARAGDRAMRAVLDLMERNADRTRLGRYLPPGVTLAHKDGWMDDVDNDAGVLTARTGVIAVGFTSGVPALTARPLLGLLGLAAAKLAGSEITGLPLELAGGA
jgi:beta-lactamase class A